MSLHKHATIIAAWVLGEKIQGQSPSTDKWTDIYMFADIDKDNNFLGVSPLHPEYDWWPNWRIAP